jgi:hypothetical protein
VMLAAEAIAGAAAKEARTSRTADRTTTEGGVRIRCQLLASPIAISGKATMKPSIRPMAAPELKVAVRERAPVKAPVRQMRAATPQPIQKMEGIKSAAYRTDKAKESVGHLRTFLR